MKILLSTFVFTLLSSAIFAQPIILEPKGHQTQGATFGEKVNASKLASSLQSFDGIVVKGGKTASAKTILLTTNSSGEFTFTITESGNYSLTLSTGDNPLYQEAGQSANNPISQRANPGTPIGGIIVKGGKNPGGNMLIIETNGNGELELRDLTPGTYTFKATAPPLKSSSGLKDTLKTQV
ncbi:MAG: hypothetical protein V4687_03695 [Bacteroidota bacterium]